MPEMQSEITTPRRRRHVGAKNLVTAVANGEFEPDRTLSSVKRAAQVLLEAADRYPLETMPWRYLYKAISGEKKVLQESSPMVIELQKRSQAIRNELEKHAHSGLVVEETGVRCTINDADFAEHVGLATAKRLVSVSRKLQQRAANFNPSNIPSAHPMKKFGHALHGVARELKAADYETKLRLPPPKTKRSKPAQSEGGEE
jgi:hypothetical protein